MSRIYADVIPDYLPALVMLPDDFVFDLVKWNETSHAITFVQVPTFDSDPWPEMGDAIRVNLMTQEVKKICKLDDPWIYHHKWTMVKEDYSGFDVAEARRVDESWSMLPGIDKSRIGKSSYWQENVLPLLK